MGVRLCDVFFLLLLHVFLTILAVWNILAVFRRSNNNNNWLVALSCSDGAGVDRRKRTPAARVRCWQRRWRHATHGDHTACRDLPFVAHSCHDKKRFFFIILRWLYTKARYAQIHRSHCSFVIWSDGWYTDRAVLAFSCPYRQQVAYSRDRHVSGFLHPKQTNPADSGVVLCAIK